MMTSQFSRESPWKNIFLSMASHKSYSGSSLSSIKSPSMSFSIQEKIRFLEADKSLSLLPDDDGNSLLILHNFHHLTSSNQTNDQKLAAIARLDSFSSPVIINTPSIKNYSQIVPKWDILKILKSTTEFQTYCDEMETTTISNAIIIPLQLLHIFITPTNLSPESLAIKVLNEMNRLDTSNQMSSNSQRTPSYKHSTRNRLLLYFTIHRTLLRLLPLYHPMAIPVHVQPNQTSVLLFSSGPAYP
jgi:hypothetical protein